jgi:plastocyanin
MRLLTNKATLGLLAAAAIAVPIAGCGSSDDSSDDSSSSTDSAPVTNTQTTDSGDAAGSGTLALAADPSGAIKFDKTSLTAPAGKVTIDFTNESQVPHAVEVEGNGVEEETDTVTGGKATLTADLKPGTYTFYCPVGDHREDGMEGTLTVQ